VRVCASDIAAAAAAIAVLDAFDAFKILFA
jgi:hypothetical protein